jgi:hypothetical protein
LFPLRLFGTSVQTLCALVNQAALPLPSSRESGDSDLIPSGQFSLAAPHFIEPVQSLGGQVAFSAMATGDHRNILDDDHRGSLAQHLWSLDDASRRMTADFADQLFGIPAISDFFRWHNFPLTSDRS